MNNLTPYEQHLQDTGEGRAQWGLAIAVLGLIGVVLILAWFWLPQHGFYASYETDDGRSGIAVYLVDAKTHEEAREILYKSLGVTESQIRKISTCYYAGWFSGQDCYYIERLYRTETRMP